MYESPARNTAKRDDLLHRGSLQSVLASPWFYREVPHNLPSLKQFTATRRPAGLSNSLLVPIISFAKQGLFCKLGWEM
jgi:hypothetical protein